MIPPVMSFPTNTFGTMWPPAWNTPSGPSVSPRDAQALLDAIEKERPGRMAPVTQRLYPYRPIQFVNELGITPEQYNLLKRDTIACMHSFDYRRYPMATHTGRDIAQIQGLCGRWNHLLSVRKYDGDKNWLLIFWDGFIAHLDRENIKTSMFPFHVRRHSERQLPVPQVVPAQPSLAQIMTMGAQQPALRQVFTAPMSSDRPVLQPKPKLLPMPTWSELVVAMRNDGHIKVNASDLVIPLSRAVSPRYHVQGFGSQTIKPCLLDLKLLHALIEDVARDDRTFSMVGKVVYYEAKDGCFVRASNTAALQGLVALWYQERYRFGELVLWLHLMDEKNDQDVDGRVCKDLIQPEKLGAVGDTYFDDATESEFVVVDRCRKAE